MKNWNHKEVLPEVGRDIIMKCWLPENAIPLVVAITYAGEEWVLPDASTMNWCYMPGKESYTHEDVREIQQEAYDEGFNALNEISAGCPQCSAELQKIKKEAPQIPAPVIEIRRFVPAPVAKVKKPLAVKHAPVVVKMSDPLPAKKVKSAPKAKAK